jgi:hypothetical protein
MSDLTNVTFDLEGHELARLSAVLTAAADNLSLVTMHALECDARRMLYGGLDAEQRAIYQQLTEAGILNGHMTGS